MSISEQSATNAKPLTWSEATARARALRESVEALATEEVSSETAPFEPAPFEPAPIVSISPETTFESSPIPSLAEAPLNDLAPLPAPPEPPSSLGLPVLPLPPVPPVFASTEPLASTEPSANPEPFASADLPFATETVESAEAGSLFSAEPAAGSSLFTTEPADAAFGTDELFNAEPTDAIEAPFATEPSAASSLFAAKPTNDFLAPEAPGIADLPFGTEPLETTGLSDLPFASEPAETMGLADLPFATEAAAIDAPSEAELAALIKANSMPDAPNAFPLTAETTAEQPLAAIPAPQIAPLPIDAALPPLPPPPPPPEPSFDQQAADSLPPLPPPPPPPEALLPEPSVAPAMNEDLSMFGAAPTLEPTAEFVSEMPQPPTPSLFSEQAAAPIPPAPPAWDTPIATPVPTENPAQPAEFTASLDPAATEAFDAPFPTTVAPTETWTLQSAEPAPFPSVDAPQVDTGGWLSATGTGSPQSAPHELGEGMSLFGRPAAPVDSPLSESLETWPAAASGDWPTASSSAAMPVATTGAAGWPATDTTDIPAPDPLLAAAPPTPGSETAPTLDEVPQVERSEPRQSFFKRILSRKEEEPEVAPHMCQSCNCPARVDIDSPSLGVRHLSCPKCAKMWTEPNAENSSVHS